MEKKFDRLEQLKASLTYAFENVENYNVEPGAILSAQDVGHVRVSSLSPALVWDLRDDIFNPRKGALYGVVLKQAMHQLGSDADFTKLSVQSQLVCAVSVRCWSGALSARAGMAWPHYRDRRGPPPRAVLPGRQHHRPGVYAGLGRTGRSTARPRAEQAWSQFNAEAAVHAERGLGIRAVLRCRQCLGRSAPGLNDLRASFGAGIRYGTPVGPLRIDYGQKIHRRPGESPGELHFNIGHTF